MNIIITGAGGYIDSKAHQWLRTVVFELFGDDGAAKAAAVK